MRHHPHPTMVDVEKLRTMLEERRAVTVLDVRAAEDRAEWSIPGSIHVDAYEALKAGDPDALAGLELPESTPVVTVCGVGKTSMTARDQLRLRGIETWSLSGGMKAWSLAWNSAEVSTPGSEATVLQVRRTGKGCLSYVIGHGDEAAVIDAALDPYVYVDLARSCGWRITHVLDTHVHADHLSRTRRLAEITGATLHLPAQDRVTYPFSPLRDGDTIVQDGIRLTAMHTPGHTPEAMSYLLDGRVVFTGDTLFLAGVGRPDLEASVEQANERARLLYQSLRTLTALASDVRVLPGHTSEPVPFDGNPIMASLDEVIDQVKTLGLSEDAFVETIVARIPPTPPNHAAIVAFNEAGALPEGDLTDLEAGANRCAVS